MFLGTLCTRGFSRHREFYADAIGAALTSPDAMLRALRKIHGFNDEAAPGEKDFKMLMFRAAWNGHWFATHPTLEQRTSALMDRIYLARIEALAGVEQQVVPAPKPQLSLKHQRELEEYQPAPASSEPFEWPEIPYGLQLFVIYIVVSVSSFFVGLQVF
jgi:hypothetical protein